MRLSSKAIAIAACGVAALGFTPQAGATETVQVVSEDFPAATCGTVSGGGGCRVHFAGTAELRVDFGFFGEIHQSTCNLELETRFNGTGGLAVDALEHNTGPDPHCSTNYTECGLPWSASGEEDSPVGVLEVNLGICIDPSESSLNCVGSLPFALVESAGEHYETQFNNASVGVCEFDVDLEVEHAQAGNLEIHINHP